jgi:hypothetical protein
MQTPQQSLARWRRRTAGMPGQCSSHGSLVLLARTREANAVSAKSVGLGYNQKRRTIVSGSSDCCSPMTKQASESSPTRHPHLRTRGTLTKTSRETPPSSTKRQSAKWSACQRPANDGAADPRKRQSGKRRQLLPLQPKGATSRRARPAAPSGAKQQPARHDCL